MEAGYTNELIQETSPYLLQHAHNPVNWKAWNEATLGLAVSSNKLIIISIGYSACHWCHVMEQECFEDRGVAELMNDFVCIKVDREERPDVDQLYLEAVQLMQGRGGWPLNCIALPDGRPIFGGTYFPRDEWMRILKSVLDFWKDKPEDAVNYAASLASGVQTMGLFSANFEESEINKLGSSIGAVLEEWKKQFDLKLGGFKGAPKFPLPGNWLFLMRSTQYSVASDTRKLVEQALVLTLKQMAFGGIFDHLSGGFSRYSTDSKWLAPHFEKMLYDNAQLVGLYAEGFQMTGDSFYKEVAKQTFKFLYSYLRNPEGGYYSALDADSEGVEGKFYTWTSTELTALLGDHAPLFNLYYGVTEKGNWEGVNILHRSENDDRLAAGFGLDLNEMLALLARSRSRLLIERERRVPPGLDDKIICSWNALLVAGLARSSVMLGDRAMGEAAEKLMEFILDKLVVEGRLMRTYKDGRARIDGFLDDYVFLTSALLELHQYDQQQRWLDLSYQWMERTIELFFDAGTGMPWYTSRTSEKLFARKQEVFDQVIPSSSSEMARVLYKLSFFYARDDYERMSLDMLQTVLPQLLSYPTSFANWSLFQMECTSELTQLVIVGNSAFSLVKEVRRAYMPFSIMLASEGENSLPLLVGKTPASGGGVLIYVCKGKTCYRPVESLSEALNLVVSPL